MPKWVVKLRIRWHYAISFVYW